MLVEKLALFVKIEKYCDNQWVLSLTNLVINPVHRMFSFIWRTYFPSTITKYRLEEEVTRDSGGNSTGNPRFLLEDFPCSDHRSIYSQLICFHPEFQDLKHRDK